MVQDIYAHERGDPAVPQCGASRVSILFDGKMLRMRSPKVHYSWSAVSGRPDGNNHFEYSVARQQLAGVGPIPAGEYWVNPSELWTRRWYGFGQATHGAITA